MNELGQIEARYDTKTIEYSEDGPGAYALMITRFDGEGNEILGRKGFRGEYLLITKLGPGKMDSWHDVYQAGRAFTAHDDDYLTRFLSQLERDYDLWLEIEDGERLTPSKIEGILDGD